MNYTYLLFVIYLFSAQLSKADPPFPACIDTEESLKAWVEKTITDAPPPGGTVEMLKHWPRHYAKNDRVGEIWIVPAVVKITTEDGTFDHEMAFIAYHVDTDKTSIEVLFSIPENVLDKYLKPEPTPTPEGQVAT